MTSDEFKEERGIALAERTIERLWILTILLVILLVGSNGAWLYYESSFEDTTTTIQQDVDADSGNAAIFDGVHINNGESETDSNN